MTLLFIIGAIVIVILIRKYWDNIGETSDKLDRDFIENNRIENTSKRLNPIDHGRFGWLDLWLNFSSIDDKKEDKR